MYTIVTIYDGPNGGRIVHAYDTFATRGGALKDVRVMKRDPRNEGVDIRVVKIIALGDES